jgi:hypothetical protein
MMIAAIKTADEFDVLAFWGNLQLHSSLIFHSLLKASVFVGRLNLVPQSFFFWFSLRPREAEEKRREERERGKQSSVFLDPSEDVLRNGVVLARFQPPNLPSAATY